MPRFLSWLSIGLAAAFLVVATASFSEPVVKWLAFADGVGVCALSAGTAVMYRRHTATLFVYLATLAVSAWTVVASLVFSLSTVDDLSLASALTIAGLAIVGITIHELSTEIALELSGHDRGELGGHLSAAA